MHLFKLLKSLETQRIVEGQKIGEILSEKEVYLIVDDASHKIFIYRGTQSTLVLYLIALRLSSELKKHLGISYHVEDSPSEEILSTIKDSMLTTAVSIPEIINPRLLPKSSEPSGDIKDSSIPAKEEEIPLPGEGTIYLQTTSNWVDDIDGENMNLFKSQKISDLFEKTKATPLPKGYFTEMTLIGSTVYAESEKLEKFIPTRKIKTYHRKLGILPDGIFLPSDNYSSRICIDGGKIQSLEFIAKTKSDLAPNESINLSAAGKIAAPVLFIHRITTERDLSIIKESFNIPPDDMIEELIEKAKEELKSQSSG